MQYLKQSTSVDVGMGPFLDESDGKTPETTLTITQPDVRLKKNGGNWAQKNAAQTLSHEENGWYEVTLDATDTNTLGELIVAIHESGALPVWRIFTVLPANVYDALVAGSDKLEIDVAQYGGTNGTFSGGRPEVNLTHWSGSTANADLILTVGSDYNNNAGFLALAGDGTAIGDWIGVNGANLNSIPWNAAWDAEVQSEVNDGLVVLGLDHLISASVTGTDVADNSIIAKMVSKSATADWDSFVNTTDALEAIKDDQTSNTVWTSTHASKLNRLPDINAGASNGLVIVGANAGSMSLTGSLSLNTGGGASYGLSIAGVLASLNLSSAAAPLTTASGDVDLFGLQNTGQNTLSIVNSGTHGNAAIKADTTRLARLVASTTIATLASQTSFTLTAGSADDNAYNDWTIVVTDASTATQKAAGTVSDYVGSTRTITLDADPGVFTMAVGDTVDLLPPQSMNSNAGAGTADEATVQKVLRIVQANARGK